MSAVTAACYDGGPFWFGQLYVEVIGTEWETETAPEPPIISRGSVLTSKLWVGPSILVAEVEGPLSWPLSSVAGSGPIDKTKSLMGCYNLGPRAISITGSSGAASSFEAATTGALDFFSSSCSFCFWRTSM